MQARQKENKINRALNPMEMLWKKLKQAAHVKEPTYTPELKLLYSDKWAKILSSRYAELIDRYWKH